MIEKSKIKVRGHLILGEFSLPGLYTHLFSISAVQTLHFTCDNPGCLKHPPHTQKTLHHQTGVSLHKCLALCIDLRASAEGNQKINERRINIFQRKLFFIVKRGCSVCTTKEVGSHTSRFLSCNAIVYSGDLTDSMWTSWNWGWGARKRLTTCYLLKLPQERWVN